MPKTQAASSPFKLLLSSDRAAVVAGTDHTLTVLVRLQAPEPPPNAQPRQPLHLALVLDRSGSMAGEPMQEARNCARYVVDNLAPNDWATVIAFDDEVECVAPLGPVGDKLALRAAIASIDTAGSTNLHGGWLTGAEQLMLGIAEPGVHRVILLSDGNANAGETELEAIAGQCRDRARSGISTSTYGLGRDFNEDLMLAMAKAGRGNAYYGETAADLADPFQSEFALLTSLCARGLVIKVNAPAEVGVTMLNDCEPVEGEVHAWKLPDIAFGSEAWSLLQLVIPATLSAASSPMQLPLSIAVQAAQSGSTPLFMMSTLPALPVVTADAWAALSPDELVARRMLEVAAGDLLEAVRTALGDGDWAAAEALLTQAETRFGENPWTLEIIATVRRLVNKRDDRMARKEAAYARAFASGRLAFPGERPDRAGEEDIPSFLRRKGEQGKGNNTF